MCPVLALLPWCKEYDGRGLATYVVGIPKCRIVHEEVYSFDADTPDGKGVIEKIRFIISMSGLITMALRGVGKEMTCHAWKILAASS